MILSDRNHSDMICELVAEAYDYLDSPRIKDWKNMMDAIEFRREFGTIKIQLARQTGHTTAAVRLLFAHDDALIYLPNSGSMRGIRDEIARYTKLRSIRSVMEKRVTYVGYNYGKYIEPVNGRSMVIIDQASNISKKELDIVKERYRDAKLIVELQ